MNLNELRLYNNQLSDIKKTAPLTNPWQAYESSYQSISTIDQRKINKLDDDIKKFEPLIALNGGNDGLDVITKVIYKAKEILKANGRLALEISNEQVLQVSKILEKNNFRIEYFVNDYKDNIRSLISILIK